MFPPHFLDKFRGSFKGYAEDDVEDCVQGDTRIDIIDEKDSLSRPLSPLIII